MPMAPYVIVLAKNTHEGATYARRAPLTRGRYRIAVSAGSIRGLRRAEVHILPSFDQKPDRHAILAELRWAKCDYFYVEMPERQMGPAIDQGDGMGEQLTIDDALAASSNGDNPELSSNEDISNGDAMVSEGGNIGTVELEDSIPEHGGAPGDLVDPAQLDEEVKKRRRTRCKKCGQLHLADEPCPTVESNAQGATSTGEMFD